MGPLSEHIESLDASEVCTQFLLSDEGIGLVVREKLKDEWFYVLSPSGGFLQEADDRVRRLRESHLLLQAAFYRLPGQRIAAPVAAAAAVFDRHDYLAKCRAEFEPLRYAPLAALGARFPNAKLQEVYVPAQAEVDDVNAESTMYRQVVNDILDTLQLDDVQRAQLEVQLREGFGGNQPRETGLARGLYQQYGNILLLGDPGSGKTCFVKNEVLTYCRPPDSGGSWYTRHLPVYVPLVEAGSIFSSSVDLNETCSIVAARRGLSLTSEQLRGLAAEGHVAFFFDGLDEVGSLEQRARLAEAIGKVLDESAALGNRVALTSRPAAIQLVEIPDNFTSLHLRGLTDAEMRSLAENVFASR